MQDTIIDIKIPVEDALNGMMSFDHNASLREEIEQMRSKKRESFSVKQKKNPNKYRVNYLLDESFHYSLVEADNKDTADEIVFKYLGEPDEYKLLGVEEDKTYMLEPGNDSAMTEIINKLIIDEWEAISGYNSASVTAQQLGLEDTAALFADLSKEEIEHVGELQQLLKSFDKNIDAIKDGAEEAEDKLED